MVSYWFIQILNMSITAGFCIIGVLLLRLALRRAPRVYLYALWLIVAFRLVCPVSFSYPLSLFNLIPEAQGAGEYTHSMDYIQSAWTQLSGAAKDSVQAAKEPETMDAGGDKAAGLLAEEGPEGRIRSEALYGSLQAAFHYGIYLWILGMAAFLGYYLVSLWRLRRHTGRAVLFRRNMQTPWGRRRVYECDGRVSPFVMGIFRPAIYIPCGLTEQEQKPILWHESYHIYRKDYAVKLFAFFLLAVYWFHPLVWVAWKMMCRDMEASCDEAVLLRLSEREKKDYSRALLSFASEKRRMAQMPPGFGENDVKHRIRHILNYRKASFGMAAACFAAVVIAFMALAFNGTGESETAPEPTQEPLETLYAAKTPYVGDPMADGVVIRSIGSALPEWGFQEVLSHGYKSELQTVSEPYGFCFVFGDEENPNPWDADEEIRFNYEMHYGGVLMMALIDNLGEVDWRYYDENGTRHIWYWDLEAAREWLGVEDLKAYAESSQKLQELLDMLEEKRANPQEEEFPEVTAENLSE